MSGEKRNLQSNIRGGKYFPRNLRFIRCSGNMLFSCFIDVTPINFFKFLRYRRISTFLDIALLRLRRNYYCVRSWKKCFILNLSSYIFLLIFPSRTAKNFSSRSDKNNHVQAGSFREFYAFILCENGRRGKKNVYE